MLLRQQDFAGLGLDHIIAAAAAAAAAERRVLPDSAILPSNAFLSSEWGSHPVMVCCHQLVYCFCYYCFADCSACLLLLIIKYEDIFAIVLFG